MGFCQSEKVGTLQLVSGIYCVVAAPQCEIQADVLPTQLCQLGRKAYFCDSCF